MIFNRAEMIHRNIDTVQYYGPIRFSIHCFDFRFDTIFKSGSGLRVYALGSAYLISFTMRGKKKNPWSKHRQMQMIMKRAITMSLLLLMQTIIVRQNR